MNRFYKTLLPAVALLFATTANSQSYNGPESVDYDPVSNRYFIANTNSGEILERDASGNLGFFATGLASGPHGLEVVGNTLYACSGGSLRGFDLTTGNSVLNLNMGAGFLNGITSDGSSVWVTDFSSNNILRYDIAGGNFNVYVANTGSTPNGIIYDAPNNRLVFVSWGNNAPIKAVSLVDSTVTTLASTTTGNMDGVALDCNGNFYISSWSPTDVRQWDNAFASSFSLGIQGLDSPADLYYNNWTDTLAVPNSGGSGNDVSFVAMSGCGGVGVDEAGNESKITIYPNPATDQINLEVELNDAGSLYFELLDLTGKMVLREKQTMSYNGGLQQFSVALKELPNGTYLARLTTPEGVFTQRVSIVK
jgi:hypothetical protein